MAASVESRRKALLTAGLVGLAAFSRGGVSGAQTGCGGEIGVGAAMASGAAVSLFGGSWDEVDAAAVLAASPFIGIECSPAFGLVEFPCVPRNGFGAICAIAAAEAAMAGIRPPYNIDETFDRVFGVGALLPVSLRETESGPWMASATTPGDAEEMTTCGSCSCGSPKTPTMA
jgi:L-serine dehydratase